MTKAHTRVFGKSGAFEAPKPKQKFVVLNRQTKGAKQINVVKSRTKALNKRKQSLLRELNTDNKVNTFVDERIGEREQDQPASNLNLQDEKFMRRFQVERARQLVKARKQNFSLEDEDELTHMGQSIGSVQGRGDDGDGEGFSDYDDDDTERNIDADEVKFSHFGGGEFESEKSQDMRAGMSSAKFAALTREPTPEERARMSKKDIMENIIQRSKLFKLDRQMKSEEMHAMATELDKNFSEVARLLEYKTDMDWMDEKVAKRADTLHQGHVGLDGRAIPSFKGDNPNALDDFTMEARRLATAQRAYAAEKLKSTDDVVRDERERLMRLETLRQKRMKGEDTSLDWEAADAAFNAGKDLAGDDDEWDLDEELTAHSKSKTSSGKVSGRVAALRQRRAEIKAQKRKEARRLAKLERTASDSESDGSELEESDAEPDDSPKKRKASKNVKFATGDDLEENFELDDGMIIDSDADSDEDDNDDDDDDVVLTDSEDEDETSSAQTAPRVRITPEQAAKALPFVFTAPRNFTQLQALLDTRGDETPESIKDHETIVYRLQKLHHVRLNEPENVSKMEILTRCLFRYMRVTCERETARVGKFESKRPKASAGKIPSYSSSDMTFAKLDWITRRLFDLSDMLPRFAARISRELIEAIAANAHERLQKDDETQNEDEEATRNPESTARRFEELDHMTDHLPQAASVEADEEGEDAGKASSSRPKAPYRKSDMPLPHEILGLKLLGNLYPVTDHRHNIITPMFTLLAEILSTFPIRGGRDLTVGVFIVAILVEWSSESKRLIPEVAAFLHTILSRGFGLERYTQVLERKAAKAGAKESAKTKSASNNNADAEIEIPTTIDGYSLERRKYFVAAKTINMLLHDAAFGATETDASETSSSRRDGTIWEGFDLSLPADPIEVTSSFVSDEPATRTTFAENIPISLLFLAHNDFNIFKHRSFKTAMLNTILNLVRLYARTLSSAPAFIELFSPIICVLDTILLKSKCPVDRVPEMASSASLHSQWEQKKPQTAPGERVLLLRSILHAHIRELLNTPIRKPLLRIARPVEIASKEPQFMEDFEPGKVESSDKQREETRKLLKKLKREKKGAIREIRRDAQFIAQEQRRAQAKVDERRVQKKQAVLTMLDRERQDTNLLAKVSSKKR